MLEGRGPYDGIIRDDAFLSELVPSHILLVHCVDWGLTLVEMHGSWGPELMHVIRYGLPIRGLYPRPY